MVNAKKKGDRNERECKKILESFGYTVIKPHTIRWNREDFFEYFDIIAIHPNRKILFVQVKTNGANGIMEFMEEVPKMVNMDISRTEYWCRYDGEGWRIIDVQPDERRDILDEREHPEYNIGDYVKEQYPNVISEYITVPENSED